MRRIFLMALAASALVLSAPAAASAHHARHHARHARRHHHKVLVFGSLSSSGASSTAPQSASPSPLTPSSGDRAGTVKEFTAGVLTILLSDEKTLVSGKVTEQTEIHCQAAAPTEADDDAGEVGDNSGGGDSNSGPVAHSSDNTTGSGGDDNGGGDEHGGQVSSACTTEALKPGTVVREAELSVGSGGAVWDQIDLIQ